MRDDDELEPQAAVALVHAQLPEESILILRRTRNERDPWSGHWAFPGGRRDAVDRDLLDTALRELREEVGIVLERGQMTERLPDSDAGRRVGRVVRVAAFAFRVPEPLPFTLQASEAEEAVWMPVARVLDLTHHRVQAVPGLPPEMLFPSIDVGGVPLWGFTYRMICRWLRVEPPG